MTVRNQRGCAPRRAVYREAKRKLRRALRHAWNGTHAALESFIRRALRGQSRDTLRSIARGAVLPGVLGALAFANSADADSIALAEIASNEDARGFAIHGMTEGELSGYSISDAGDVNGDGLGDVILGAYRAAPNGDVSGAAYVVFGKTDGAAVDLADISLGTDDGGFVINGAVAGDKAGFRVAGGGDVNGDGLGDLIVGAYKASPHGAESGTTYVVFGKADGAVVELSDIAADVNDGGFAMFGAAAGDNAGYGLSHAGDINGDGLDDVIVGALKAAYGYYAPGSTFVVFGKTDGAAVELSDIAMDSDAGGFALYGDADGERSGRSVSGVGDMNKDGFDDLIVGAWAGVPNGLFSGIGYVVFGKADGTSLLLGDIASDADGGGFAINGAALGDRAGFSVRGAGDVNGDSTVDVLIGAWQAQPNGSGTGTAYAVFGKSDGTAIELADIAMDANAGGFAMHGEDPGDGAGFSLDGLGDYDGDGLDDVLIGTQSASINNDRAGLAYVIYGKATGSAIELSGVPLNGSQDGVAILGEVRDDFAGNFVSRAGDVNGDGAEDVLIGAFGADPAGEESGTSYVIFAPVAGNTRWIDLGNTGTEDGSYDFPFNSLTETLADLPDGGTINFKAGGTPRSTPETAIITEPIKIQAFGGKVTIGAN